MNLFKGIKQNTDVMDNVPGGNQVGRGLLDAAGIFSATFNSSGGFFRARGARTFRVSETLTKAINLDFEKN